MKDLRNLVLFLVPTLAVIVLLAKADMQNLPTWILPVAALLAVVVLPLALSVWLTKRKGSSKQA